MLVNFSGCTMGVQDLSSLSRDQTCAPCTESESHNHRVTREVSKWVLFKCPLAMGAGRASQARTPTLMAPPGPASSGGRLDAAQQPGLDLLTLSSTRQSQPCFPDLRTAPSPSHQWDPFQPPLMSWADLQTQALQSFRLSRSLPIRVNSRMTPMSC